MKLIRSCTETVGAYRRPSGRLGIAVVSIIVMLPLGCVPLLPDLNGVEPFLPFEDGKLALKTLTPTRGAVGGETIVLLRGEGFVAGMQVRFGEALSDQVIVYSDKMATAKVPSHSAGVVDVSVEALIEQADRKVDIADGFTFIDPGGEFAYGGDVDTDGDGLSDIKELEGWLIKIDPFGFGLDSRNTTNNGTDVIVTFTVVSDPELADTDGDGLSDGEEFVIKTNPADADTDDDGLSDDEEFNRWRTSPVSVDTDGDARSTDPSSSFSTLPPNPRLFDGAELFDLAVLLEDPADRGDTKLGATSPTLADTDGDGVSDFDEIDTPVRTPLLADMPQLLFEIVDDVDIRLDVEYAEEEGQSTSFEASFTTIESRSLTQSQSNTVSNSVTVGAEVSIGVDDLGVSSSVDVTTGYEQTWSTDVQSSVSSEQTFSRIEQKSRTHTETAASGSMITGIRVSNIGNISVQVIDLGFTVRQWQPNRNVDASDTNPGRYLTFAELIPDLGPGLTLSPGSDSGVLQAVASDINPDRVKAFLTRPDSLQIEPAAFELINEAGINFAFIEEVTRARTARVSIDFGDGRFEEYRIATNVDRNADGSLAGITLDKVMDLTVGVGNWQAEHFENDGADDCADAVPIFEGATPFNNEDATTDGPPDCSGDNFGKDIWYHYLPTFTGTLTVDTCAEQDFDTILTAYTGDCDNLVQIGCDDDGCPDGLQSIIEVEVNAGEEILIRVGSFLPDRGTGILTLTGPNGTFDTLTRVRDVDSDLEAPRFWSVFLSGQETVGGQGFSQTTLHAGDTVLIALSKDEDGDGLFAAQEQQYGSSDNEVDTDGDGLKDPEEAARQYRIDGELFEGGWDVRVTLRDATVLEYRTYSDPRRTDTDQDGLDDDAERLGLDGFPPGHGSDTNDATDPTLADTDGDGLADNVDPAPTFAARILHVDRDAQGGDGLSWDMAQTFLHRAIARAEGFNLDRNPTNDITEIWVAQGAYQPGVDESFRLLAGVAIYGGFEGSELKRAQRVADGRFNGTILSPRDARVLFISVVAQGATLDGFTLDAAGTERVSAILSIVSSNTYRNLFIIGFSTQGQSPGVGTVVLEGGADEFEDCTFANNVATTTIWGPSSTVMVLGGAAPTFTGCTFSNNTATTVLPSISAKGGALFADSGTSPTLVQCRFLNNVADAGVFPSASGGAVFLNSGTIVGCEFRGNGITALRPIPLIWSTGRSGGALTVAGECTILNSVFFGNQSESFGGAVFVQESGDARMINCSLSGNHVSSSGGRGRLQLHLCYTPNCGHNDDVVWDVEALATGAAVGVEGNLDAENCIFWGNTSATPLILLKGTNRGDRGTGDFEIGLGQEIQISTRPHYAESAFAPIIFCVGGAFIEAYDWPIGAGGTIRTQNCAVQDLGHIDTRDADGCYILHDPYFPGTVNGVGNIARDPGFIDAAAGNLGIQLGSPVVDAGQTLLDAGPFLEGFQGLPDTDFAGNPRVVDGSGNGIADVDIGAYEVQDDN